MAAIDIKAFVAEIEPTARKTLPSATIETKPSRAAPKRKTSKKKGVKKKVAKKATKPKRKRKKKAAKKSKRKKPPTSWRRSKSKYTLSEATASLEASPRGPKMSTVVPDHTAKSWRWVLKKGAVAKAPPKRKTKPRKKAKAKPKARRAPEHTATTKGWDVNNAKSTIPIVIETAPLLSPDEADAELRAAGGILKSGEVRPVGELAKTRIPIYDAQAVLSLSGGAKMLAYILSKRIWGDTGSWHPSPKGVEIRREYEGDVGIPRGKRWGALVAWLGVGARQITSADFIPNPCFILAFQNVGDDYTYVVYTFPKFVGDDPKPGATITGWRTHLVRARSEADLDAGMVKAFRSISGSPWIVDINSHRVFKDIQSGKALEQFYIPPFRVITSARGAKKNPTVEPEKIPAIDYEDARDRFGDDMQADPAKLALAAELASSESVLDIKSLQGDQRQGQREMLGHLVLHTALPASVAAEIIIAVADAMDLDPEQLPTSVANISERLQVDYWTALALVTAYAVVATADRRKDAVAVANLRRKSAKIYPDGGIVINGEKIPISDVHNLRKAKKFWREFANRPPETYKRVFVRNTEDDSAVAGVEIQRIYYRASRNVGEEGKRIKETTELFYHDFQPGVHLLFDGKGGWDIGFTDDYINSLASDAGLAPERVIESLEDAESLPKRMANLEVDQRGIHL